MAGVTLRAITKRFPGRKGEPVEALRGFDLEVRDREFLVLVGPSGCGKTTTLRLIAGLEQPTAGTIFIGDREVNRVPPKDRGIAMVFQNFALYPHLTAEQNIAFGLKLQKLTAAQIRRRVDEAVEILDLKEVLRQKPRELSGGQKQRVALGRALVRQPQVYLFDEPLASLDGKLRAQLRAELMQLHERVAATMIYVTHDTTEAMTMGDRIAVMRAGQMEQTGEPLAVYHAPVNRFVGGFLGQPPMNFIRGVVVTGRMNGLHFKEAGEGVIEGEFAPPPPLSLTPGSEVLLGIRPEEIDLDADESVSGKKEGGLPFQALVELVEPLGAETHVHLQTGGHRLIARTPLTLSHARQGKRIRFGIRWEKARLFDATTERLLGIGGGVLSADFAD